MKENNQMTENLRPLKLAFNDFRSWIRWQRPSWGARLIADYQDRPKVQKGESLYRSSPI